MICLILFTQTVFGDIDSHADCRATKIESDVDTTDARVVLSRWLSDDTHTENANRDLFAPFVITNNTSPDCKQTPESEIKRLTPILDAVKRILSTDARGEIFVMLNGANAGVFIPYRRGCLLTMTNAAATALSVSATDLALPKRFYTVGGLPIKTDDDVTAAHGLVHLLLDQEAWVWPGVEVGFSWTLGSAFRMQTASMAPRIVYVHNLLTAEECETLCNNSMPRMYKSPVKVRCRRRARREVFSIRITSTTTRSRTFVRPRRRRWATIPLALLSRRARGCSRDCHCYRASNRRRSCGTQIPKLGVIGLPRWVCDVMRACVAIGLSLIWISITTGLVGVTRTVSLVTGCSNNECC
jgi:hypothetical protein